MGEEKNKALEQLVDNLMEDLPPEEPSKDFTANIMERIGDLKPEKVYEPVISKPVFWGILIVFCIAMIYLSLSTDLSGGWFGDLRILPKMTDTKFSFPDIKVPFSNTLLYAVLALGIMVGIQISLLKNYFDKRLLSNT